MIVIPAIDIKDRRCVRLRQGNLSQETVFSDVPEEMAVRWFEKGAERLHIVDLNGAVEGRAVNKEVIKKIGRTVPIPLQLGGGIRDMDILEAYLDLGVHYAILGTVAYKNPDLVIRACEKFPGRIILGIDAKKERVAVEGWTEEVDLTPVEMTKRFEKAGFCSVIFTDIYRDGMRTGPNVEATRGLARAINIPVIASGGISRLSDVMELSTLASDGVIGMITGRALYDGSLDLSEAISAARGGTQRQAIKD